MDIPLDPTVWGSNPAVAIVALAALVAWTRTTPLGSRIDGPYMVPLFTLGVGAGAGVLLQMSGYLTLAPYSLWVVPLGGVAYGVLVGGSAVLGVSLFNYGAGKINEPGGAHGMAINTATGFIAQFLRERFGETVPGVVWQTVGPIMMEFAMSDVVLTNESRRELQARLLNALRAAGLPGVDL